jgi:hypothetical protein
MAVDLNTLPATLALPQAPKPMRWCVILFLGSLLAGVLVVLLWPSERWQASPWFWCCVLVLPMALGGVLYGVRHSAYEKQREYILGWNLSHEQQKQSLVDAGQRPIALLATAYCTGAGSKGVAAALIAGSKPLKPVSAKAPFLRINPLDTSSGTLSPQLYREQLLARLGEVLRVLKTDLANCQNEEPLNVRIRHNHVLGDEEILALWRSCHDEQRLEDRVLFATDDDGLLWLDTWLDTQQPAGPVLSLEFNLFLEAVAEQAESVTAVLMAPMDWSSRQGVVPRALIQRPVLITDLHAALDTALYWGRTRDAGNDYRVWYSQLPRDFLGDLKTSLRMADRLPTTDDWFGLDESFGLAGCAVGNMALILASEQASEEHRAQLVVLQDASPQACVVQPA